MRFGSALAGLSALLAAPVLAGSVGGGLGLFSADITDPKTAQATRWNYSSGMWSFKFVDPSGSILGAMSAVSGNYGRMLGAQQRAAEDAARNGTGIGTASYELKTSASSTGSTQTFELLWAHGGSIDYKDAAGKVTDDDLDNLTIQGSLAGNFFAWNGIAGTPISVVPYWKMIMGYFDIAADGKNGYRIEDSQAWFTFPFGAALVIDAPLRLSGKVFAGYDPITGLISIWSKNVHQAFEYGVGVEWSVLPWLVAETSYTAATTNIDNSNLWAFGTSALNFGARIDFDGF